jgi:Protein of unknown function (DUF3592)
MHHNDAVSVAMVVIIAAVVGYSLWRTWVAQSSKRWPQTDGRILVARIKDTIRREDEDTSVGGVRRQYFQIELQYEYEVNGVQYLGARLSFGSNLYRSYDDAIDALEGIAAGHDATVFYDPNDPREAVLKTGNDLHA